MNSLPHSRRWLWLVLSIVSAFSMGHYVMCIWSAGQPAHFSDLYAQWWTAHEVFLHGRPPYSLELAREIQTEIYGAPVTTASSGDPNELSGGFAYPLYVIFLLWPTLHLSFAIVQTVCACLFVILTLLSLMLWLRVLQWKPSAVEFVTLAVFALGSFPALQGIKLQNLSLLAAFLVAATLAAVAADRLVLSGVLLAAATIKPQFVILLLPWLVLWTIADWRRRRSLALSFIVTMSFLILSSELLVPGWIPRFFAIVRAYEQYTYGHSLLDVWFTPTIGSTVAVALVLGVLALCWGRRASPARSTEFLLASSLVLATTLVVIPTLAPHTQLLLLPGFLLLLRYRRSIWQSGKGGRLLLLAVWSLPAWAWLAALGMTVVGIWLPRANLLRFWMLPLYTSPLIPLGVLIVLGVVLRQKSAFEAI